METLDEPKQKKKCAFLIKPIDSHDRQHEGKNGSPNNYLLKGPRGLSKEEKDGDPNPYLPKGPFTKNTPFWGAAQHCERGEEDD